MKKVRWFSSSQTVRYCHSLPESHVLHVHWMSRIIDPDDHPVGNFPPNLPIFRLQWPKPFSVIGAGRWWRRTACSEEFWACLENLGDTFQHLDSEKSGMSTTNFVVSWISPVHLPWFQRLSFLCFSVSQRWWNHQIFPPGMIPTVFQAIWVALIVAALRNEDREKLPTSRGPRGHWKS